MGDTTHAGRRPVPYTAEEREADAMRELDRIREAQAVEPRVMVERVAIEALREALALRTAEVAELREKLNHSREWVDRFCHLAGNGSDTEEDRDEAFAKLYDLTKGRVTPPAVTPAPVAVVDDGWRPETQIVFVNGCRCRVEQRHDGWRWNVQMGNGWETNLAPTEAEAKAAAVAAAKGMR